MRKHRKSVLKATSALMTGALAAGLLLGSADVAQAKKKVSINKKRITLKIGQKTKLKLKGVKAKEAKKVKWSSKNKSVAAVDKKGVVKGKKPGSAKVVAKLGKKSYTCRVVVKKSSSSSQSSTIDWAKVSAKFEALAEYISTNGTGDEDKISIQNSVAEADETITLKISYNPSDDVILFEKRAISTDGDGLISTLTISKDEPEIASIESQIIQNGITYIGSSEIEVPNYTDEEESLGFDFGDTGTEEDTSYDEEEDSESEDAEVMSLSEELDSFSMDFFNSALSDWNDYLTDLGTGVSISELGFVSFEF